MVDGTKEDYPVAVDRWNDADRDRSAKICIGEASYPVTLKLGVVKKLSVNSGIGLLCQSEDCDVIGYEGDKALLQGKGKQEYLLLKNEKITPLALDFTASPPVYQERS